MLNLLYSVEEKLEASIIGHASLAILYLFIYLRGANFMVTLRHYSPIRIESRLGMKGGQKYEPKKKKVMKLTNTQNY